MLFPSDTKNKCTFVRVIWVESNLQSDIQIIKLTQRSQSVCFSSESSVWMRSTDAFMQSSKTTDMCSWYKNSFQSKNSCVIILCMFSNHECHNASCCWAKSWMKKWAHFIDVLNANRREKKTVMQLKTETRPCANHYSFDFGQIVCNTFQRVSVCVWITLR